MPPPERNLEERRADTARVTVNPWNRIAVRMDVLSGWIGLVAVLVAGFLPFGGPALAQEVGAGAFARMGFNARGVALGNALVADPSADVAGYYNPAQLPSTSSQRVSASAAQLAFDRQLQSLEFATPLGETAGVGFSVINAGVSDIDGRNDDGVRTEPFSTDEFAVSLRFGNQVSERVAVGVGFTLYESDVGADVDEARGIGVNLGVAVQVTDQLHLAGAVNDLLAQYEWETSGIGGNSDTDRFPVRLRFGGAYVFQEGTWRILGEVESRFQPRDRQEPGRVVPTSVGPQQRSETEDLLLHGIRGRLGVAVRPVEPLSLRVGVDRMGTEGVGGLKPGAGFGVREQIGTLDVRLGYGVVLEPHVRSVMHLGTLELFL